MDKARLLVGQGRQDHPRPSANPALHVRNVGSPKTGTGIVPEVDVNRYRVLAEVQTIY